ncbi:MAG: hypothetical protein M1813_005367 [Trichoglossum hirsutum]|nr:MAG: hypothetical protein M1813_005367 [Trichoglossum hirsutum]
MLDKGTLELIIIIDNTAPVEIISPILSHGEAGENWSRGIKQIFQALNERGGVQTNDSCGTHIHLSPQSGAWKLLDLKKLSCCILYFERAFEVLYPEAAQYHQSYSQAQRYEKYRIAANKNQHPRYAKANWTDNPKFSTACSKNVDLILAKRDVVQLIELMNPPDRPYNRLGILDRNFAWNFSNLGQKKCTIEYRRPPGIKTANACIAWVALAIRFVKAALQVEDAYYPFGADRTDPTHVCVYHLYRFLAAAQPPGPHAERYFEQLFSGKKGNLEVIPDKVRFPKSDSEL